MGAGAFGVFRGRRNTKVSFVNPVVAQEVCFGDGALVVVPCLFSEQSSFYVAGAMDSAHLEFENVVLRDMCKESDDFQNTWQAQGIVHVENSLAGAMDLSIVQFVAGAALCNIFLVFLRSRRLVRVTICFLICAFISRGRRSTRMTWSADSVAGAVLLRAQPKSVKNLKMRFARQAQHLVTLHVVSAQPSPHLVRVECPKLRLTCNFQNVFANLYTLRACRVPERVVKLHFSNVFAHFVRVKCQKLR